MLHRVANFDDVAMGHGPTDGETRWAGQSHECASNRTLTLSRRPGNDEALNLAVSADGISPERRFTKMWPSGEISPVSMLWSSSKDVRRGEVVRESEIWSERLLPERRQTSERKKTGAIWSLRVAHVD
jgi:hypothetical protein